MGEVHLEVKFLGCVCVCMSCDVYARDMQLLRSGKTFALPIGIATRDRVPRVSDIGGAQGGKEE